MRTQMPLLVTRLHRMEGSLDFRDGKSIKSNPWPPGRFEHRAWLAGWLSASRSSKSVGDTNLGDAR